MRPRPAVSSPSWCRRAPALMAEVRRQRCLPGAWPPASAGLICAAGRGDASHAGRAPRQSPGSLQAAPGLMRRPSQGPVLGQRKSPSPISPAAASCPVPARSPLRLLQVGQGRAVLAPPVLTFARLQHRSAPCPTREVRSPLPSVPQWDRGCVLRPASALQLPTGSGCRRGQWQGADPQVPSGSLPRGTSAPRRWADPGTNPRLCQLGWARGTVPFGPGWVQSPGAPGSPRRRAALLAVPGTRGRPAGWQGSAPSTGVVPAPAG